jgi:hypothetical protein
MNVRELIALLSQINPETEVAICVNERLWPVSLGEVTLEYDNDGEPYIVLSE